MDRFGINYVRVVKVTLTLYDKNVRKCPSFSYIKVFVQMNEDTMVRFSASSMTVGLILVCVEVMFIRIFAGDRPSMGVKLKRPPVSSEHLTYNTAMTLKRCKIGESL